MENRIKASIVLLIAGIVLIVLYAIPVMPGTMGEGELKYKILTVTHIISGAYKVYGNPKLGMWVAKVILTNVGTAPLYDIKISYRVEGYSDWSEPSYYPILLPNSTVVDLYYPILSSDITELTAPTPSYIKIKITYTKSSNGVPEEITESKSVTILGVHDFIFTSIPPEENTGTFYDVFDNYPLLAAWVTPTDPVVMEYADLGNKIAGGAGATLSDEEAWKSLSGMWALSVYNDITYKTEPEAFWTGKFSEYIKYPRDVIRDRAGTCIDTAIFFASLAISQGLKAYIVLMPGHAFPIIELPSGALVPVESTCLNDKVSFEEAVRAGIKTYEKAMSGPHIVVDIAAFQSLGITPPELEPLPADILERWGIKVPQAGPPPTPPSPEIQTYENPSPAWTLSYPSDWTVEPDLEVGQVFFYSPPEMDIELGVIWEQGYSAEEIRAAFEEWNAELNLKVTDEGQAQIAGMTVPYVIYSFTYNKVEYVLVCRFFSYGGYGYVVLYDFPANKDYVELCESIIATFTLGG